MHKPRRRVRHRARGFSKALFEAAMEGSGDFVVLLDHNLKVLATNTNYKDYFLAHYGRAITEGDNFLELYTDTHIKFWLPYFEKVLRGNTIHKTLRSVLTPDVVWQVRASPIHHQGRVKGIALFMRDVSLQTHAQEQLAANEANLTALIENTEDFICSVDAQQRLLICNTAYAAYIYQHYGIPLVVGDYVFAKLPEKHRKFWVPAIERALQGQSVKRVLQSSLDKKQHWEVSINPIRKKESIVGASFFIKNVSTIINYQHQLEAQTQALQSKEFTQASLIESTDDFVCLLNHRFEILLYNSAYYEYILQNYHVELVLGMCILDLLPVERVNYWLPKYERALAGEKFKVVEHGANTDVWFEVSFNPIHTPEGTVSGLSFFVKNISYIKQAEEALRKKNIELEKTNAELDRFVYSASHDLRAPLASILGIINLLRDPDISHKDPDLYIQLMERSVRRLDSFIKDIIDYSRNTRLPVKAAHIDWHTLIDEVLEHHRYLQTLDLHISKTIVAECPFASDERRIMVILNNFISNAIRYADPYKDKPFINISVECSPQQVVIQVADNGLGIGEEHLSRIFEMFYRATDVGAGSGLGLYIVKETIDKLSGRLSVESVLGEGTRFTVELPNLWQEGRVVMGEEE